MSRKHKGSDYLHTMPYQDFLQTRYWRVVRRKVHFWRQNRCDMCGKHLRLRYAQIHHPSYEYRGYELGGGGWGRHTYKRLNHLCKRCHMETHGITPMQVGTIEQEYHEVLQDA